MCWSQFSQFSVNKGKQWLSVGQLAHQNLTRTVPESCPLIGARNGHKCPSDLFVPAISRSCCDPHTHHFCIFLSCLPPSPPRFLHGTVIFLFLRWIGFSAAVTSADAAPLWFLPSFQKSLPLPLAFTSTRRPSPHPPHPPPPPPPCLHLLQGRVVPAPLCNPDSSQPKSILSEIWDITQTSFFFFFFPRKQAFHLHCSTSLLLPLFFLEQTPPPAPYSPFAFIKPRHREVQKIHFRRQQL